MKKPGQNKDDIGLLKTMISGAVGGVVFWTIMFPTDVIKSRIQVSSEKGKMLPLFVQILKKEGPMGLYNGLLPTLIRTVPATAALFASYEYSKKGMHYYFRDL